MTDIPEDHTAFTAFGRFAEAPRPKTYKKGEDFIELDKDGNARVAGRALTDEEFLERLNRIPGIDP
jgi:hypothetical protein